jgi:hypothetical protein
MHVREVLRIAAAAGRRRPVDHLSNAEGLLDRTSAQL